MASRTSIEKSDELDILSAIWILSCNDENPIITYRGLIDRLLLPKDFDVRSLVSSRPELFRPGILQSRLKAWKDLMKSGKSRPGWIATIHDAQEQHRAIEAISPNDLFRNQFRTEAVAPKASLEIIEWGLRHIERLRKDRAEEREGKLRRVGTVWIPLASLVLALLSVSVTGLANWYSLKEQAHLKYLELSFRPRQDAYVNFMSGVHSASISATTRNLNELTSSFRKIEEALLSMTPFIEFSTRREISTKLSEFFALSSSIARIEAGEDAQKLYLEQAATYRVLFEKLLFDSLLSNSGTAKIF
jgi:hypothetical protein